MHAKIVNNRVEKYPYNIGDLREENPDISFPREPLPSQILEIYGIVPVAQTSTPEYDPMTQRIQQGTPVKNNTGDWAQTWTIVLLTDEEKTARANQIQTEIINIVQYRLDEFAKTRGYDNVNSIAKYKDISDQEISSLPVDQQPLVTKFRSECRYLALAAASTWAQLYVILGQVEAGTTAMPAGFQDIEPLLPPLSWPV